MRGDEDSLSVTDANTRDIRFMRKRFYKHGGFWISVLLTLLVTGLYVLSRPDVSMIRFLGILDILEAKTLDVRFALRGIRSPDPDIVIVAIDEKTEDTLGRWQSTGRQWLAELLAVLHQAGSRAIGFDLVLAEAEQGEQPFDDHLSAAIQRTENVILGVSFYSEPQRIAHLTDAQHTERSRLLRQKIPYPIISRTGGASTMLPVPHAFGVETPLPSFAEAAYSVGHTNMRVHLDGVVREVPLIVTYDGGYYPAFSLEVARASLPSSSSGLGYSIESFEGFVQAINLPNRRIPCNETGGLLIDYYGPAYTFPHFSLSDVLSHTIPLATFQDKIVIVGFTSFLAQDLHSTPFEVEQHSGPEIQATIVSNILNEQFLTRHGGQILLESLALCVLGFVLGAILPQRSLFIGLLITVLSILGVMALSYLFFVSYHVWFNLTYPTILCCVVYLAHAVLWGISVQQKSV
jgi:adenylate cyclase